MISLQGSDLALAAALAALNALLSLWLRLQQHRLWLVASARMVGQLALVGYLLRFLFVHASPGLTLALATAMVLATIREVASRPHERLQRQGNLWASALGVGGATGLTALLLLLTSLRPNPWYEPRTVISLLGILLGSALNAASLALDGVLGGVRRERLAIEAQLALGAPAHQAFQGLVRASVRRAIVPTLNQMSAAGIITLPGIMTGQILAGADPLDAVRYQILLLFLLAGVSGLSALLAAHAALHRLTDHRDRLRLDQLSS